MRMIFYAGLGWFIRITTKRGWVSSESY